MANQIKSQTKRLIRNFLVASLLFGTACNNFLDEVPDNRVALDDLDKAAQLLTGAYSISSPSFTDWMTDNTGFIRGTTLRPNHTQAYAWEEFFDDPNEQDTPVFFWLETYNAIAQANEVLAVLESLPVTTAEEEAQKSSIESEALLTRAYGHFMLVNLFSEHYDPQSAGSDLGVPYVDTPETVFIQQYTRNTVQEVYDRVEEDMLRGIELVDDNFFANSGKYHFNRNAALAFASRFYLFKGDYDNCIEFSTTLLGQDPSVFVRDFTSDEFEIAKSSINGYPQLYTSPDQASNLLLMRKISLIQRPDFGHGPTRDIYNDLFDNNLFFGATDERRDPTFVKGTNGSFPPRHESLFERSSLNSNVGSPYHIGIAFWGEEVLLNRAESYIENGRANDAIDDLQVLIDKRYSGSETELTIDALRIFFRVGNSFFVQEASLVRRFLMLERQKEFIGQGMRWYDIKRFELEVVHALIDETTTIRLNANDPRKIIQIPTSAIDVGGLEPNPR